MAVRIGSDVRMAVVATPAYFESHSIPARPARLCLPHFGGMRCAPSRRMVSPFRNALLTIDMTSWANRSAENRQRGRHRAEHRRRVWNVWSRLYKRQAILESIGILQAAESQRSMASVTRRSMPGASDSASSSPRTSNGFGNRLSGGEALINLVKTTLVACMYSIAWPRTTAPLRPCRRPTDRRKRDQRFKAPARLAEPWTNVCGGSLSPGWSRSTRTTFAKLGLAWSLDLPSKGTLEATPLVANGIIYTTGSWGVVFAVDGRSGKLLWSYDPKGQLRSATADRVGPASRRRIVERQGLRRCSRWPTACARCHHWEKDLGSANIRSCRDSRSPPSPEVRRCTRRAPTALDMAQRQSEERGRKPQDATTVD